MFLFIAFFPFFTYLSVLLLTEPQLYVRFDIWEQGNISPLQLSDKLQGALRHALCDVVMELRVLPNPLCVGVLCPATKAQKEEAKGELITASVCWVCCVCTYLQSDCTKQSNKNNALQCNIIHHTSDTVSTKTLMSWLMFEEQQR